MATALDLIHGALRLLQVKSADVVLSAEEVNDALEVLNQLIDYWANDTLVIYQVERESFSLIPGHNPHTWGIGGNFNSERPTQIVAASINLGTTPSVDIPLQQVSYDAYEAIALKGLVTNYPREFYFDAGYPLANVYFYPVPNTATVNFQSYKPLTQFTSLTANLSMPPGYARMIRYNLACELAPEYQVSPGEDVLRIAAMSLAYIKTLNYKPTIARVDPSLVRIGRGGGRYNPYSDQRG